MSWSRSPVLDPSSEAELEKGAEVIAFRSATASGSRPLFIVALSPPQLCSCLLRDTVTCQFHVAADEPLSGLCEQRPDLPIGPWLLRLSQQALPCQTSGISCVCVEGWAGLVWGAPWLWQWVLSVRLYFRIKDVFLCAKVLRL